VRKLISKVLPIAFYLSSAWSLFIVGLVVLNVDWALPRAAGGQFESFPNWLRILYIGNFALLSIQIFAYVKKRLPLIRIFFWISLLSTFVNLISRSPLERWNALPAGIAAFAQLMLMRNSRSS
jgi:hypothetical protein